MATSYHRFTNRKQTSAPRRSDSHSITKSSDKSVGNVGQAKPAGQQKLESRGLHDAATNAGWAPGDYKGLPGWLYPVRDLDGNILTRRWKALDSSTSPKYVWPDGKPEGCDYYNPAGIDLSQAIADAAGTLYIAAGEVDLLTYVSAGIRNVLSWFGEGYVPHNLVEHLTALGARQVLYYPDRDQAGLQSACSVRDALAGSGITFEARQLPDWLPEKGDTNDLWQALGFDSAAFRDELERAPALALTEPQPDKPLVKLTRQERKPVTQGDSRTEHYARAVLDNTLGTLAATPEGGRNNQLFQTAAKLFGMALDRGWPGIDETTVQHELETIVSGWPNLRKSLGTIRSARKSAVPRALELPEREKRNQPERPPLAERVKPVDVPALSAEIVMNLRYISDTQIDDLLKYAALLIKSAIDTGKTELVKRILAALEAQLGRQPRVLVITHRQALAVDIARRFGIECYKKIDPAWLRSVPQLVIVYNSLRHLARIGEALPHYDLIVIEEVEQLHRHLFSGTFRGGEAKRAYEIARQLASEAPHVIALDAHAGTISQDWLTAVTGDVTTLVNTYRIERGALTLHAHQETVIAHGLALIETGQTPVVFATSSRKMARKIQWILIDHLGSDEGIRLIYRDNSESQDSQAFIASINTELPKLKALIYTPSLGTGIDITAPVKAVYGIFMREPLDARDCLQMLGRCRNAEQTHVHVQSAAGSQETDWQVIYQRHEQNAIRTGEHCGFNEHGIYGVTPTQQSILKLQAMLEAEHNRLTNDPLSWFVALAQDEGYTLTYHEGENRAIAEALKLTGEKIAEADKEAVLAADPVSYEELETHRHAGTLTPEVRAGHDRYIIEDNVGQTITPEIFDDLHTPQEREKLRRFTDLHDTDEEMKARDRKQAADEHLLSKRGHYTRRRAFVRTAIQAVYGDAGLDSTDELAAVEIEARITDFLTLHTGDIKRLFGWRTDQSKKPFAIFRWLLGQVGIKLTGHQVMRDRQRFYVYFIDRQQLEKQRGYANTRLAHLAQLKAKAEARADYLNHGYRDIPRALSDPHSLRPPGQDWRGRPLPKVTPRPYVDLSELATPGWGQSKCNPFSRPAHEVGVRT